jgi:hypothetical protein
VEGGGEKKKNEWREGKKEKEEIEEKESTCC